MLPLPEFFRTSVEMDLRRIMIVSEQQISCEMYAFKIQTLLSLNV